jgi:hypothetical protein
MIAALGTAPDTGTVAEPQAPERAPLGLLVISPYYPVVRKTGLIFPTPARRRRGLLSPICIGRCGARRDEICARLSFPG